MMHSTPGVTTGDQFGRRSSRADAPITGALQEPLEAKVRTPDVVIVGAQKAATTGLLQTLAQHPAVVTPRVQEATTLHTGPAGWGDWVRAYEPDLGNATHDHVLLVKLATAMHFPDTLETIKQLNPSVRLIAVLRHPVDRMLSLHRYATQHGMESRPAEEALRDDVVQRAPQWRLQTYSGGSCYAGAVAALRAVFVTEQLRFLNYDDASTSACLDGVQEFMGLPRVSLTPVRANESRSPRSGSVARATNSTVARALGRRVVPARWRETARDLVRSLNSTSAVRPDRPISAELRAQLLQRHAPDVDAAEEVLSTTLPAWRR
jgi:hypothetical protein